MPTTNSGFSIVTLPKKLPSRKIRHLSESTTRDIVSSVASFLRKCPNPTPAELEKVLEVVVCYKLDKAFDSLYKRTLTSIKKKCYRKPTGKKMLYSFSAES